MQIFLFLFRKAKSLSQFPDLNPIWADLKAYIGSYFLRTEYELINAMA
jgi:hypothetical protein